jgi:MFS family permease
MSARWAFACFLALGVYAGVWGALIPDIKRQIGATDAELGLALLFAAAGTVPGTLIAGRLWRRMGWWLLPVSAIASGVALIGPMFATSPLMLGFALLFTGFSSGMLDVAMNAAVSETESLRGTRLMYGAHALFSLGGFASFPTGIARQLGATPVLMLTGVAVVYIVVGIGSIRAARRAPRQAHGSPEAGSPPRRRDIFFSAVAGLALLCAVSFLIEDAATSWSALHLEQTLLSGAALGGAAPGLFMLFMALGRAMGQRLGARFTERSLFVTGAALAAVGLLTFAYAPSPLIALVFIAIAGSGIALVAPALYGRAGRMAHPSNRAAAIARLTSFGYTGFLIGPPLMGGLAHAMGLRGAFAVIAGLAVLLAVGGIALFRGGDTKPGTFEEGEELLKTARA